jgi:hypothetical protein
MRNTILIIIFAIGKVFNILFPYKIANRLRRLHTIFFSAWCASSFLKMDYASRVGKGLFWVNGKMISLAKRCIIGDNATLTAHESSQYVSNMKIIIGDSCMFGDTNHITAVNLIRIGK